MSIFDSLENEKINKNKIELDDIREEFDLEDSAKSVQDMSIQLTAINNVLQKNKDKLEVFLQLKELDIQKMKDTVKVYEGGTSLYVKIHNQLVSDLEKIQKNINNHKDTIKSQLQKMQDVDISINKRKIVEFNLTNSALENIEQIKKNIYLVMILGVSIVVLSCVITAVYINLYLI